MHKEHYERNHLDLKAYDHSGFDVGILHIQQKYQEYLFPPHFMGQTNGFSIVEGTPEQVNNAIIYWTPLLKMKYKPIRAAAQYVEQYMKFK